MDFIAIKIKSRLSKFSKISALLGTNKLLNVGLTVSEKAGIPISSKREQKISKPKFSLLHSQESHVRRLFPPIPPYVSIVSLILQFSELRAAKNRLMYHSFKHNCKLCGTKAYVLQRWE